MTNPKPEQSLASADTGNLTFAVIMGADVIRIEIHTVSTGLSLDEADEY